MFSVRISLTLFVRRGHQVRKLTRGIASKRSIAYAIPGLFQERMAYKPAFHAYSAILDSLFYAYGAIVDSSVKVSSFPEKHDIP